MTYKKSVLKDKTEASMKKKLLLDLAAYMETIPEDRYDQNTWMDGVTADVVTYSRAVDPNFSRVKLKEGFCNTSACVLGHATSVPSIQKAGLFIALVSDELAAERKDIEAGVELGSIFATIGKITSNGFVSGTSAASEVFNIPIDHAELMFTSMVPAVRLFYTGEYTGEPTPALVAATLRKYVETNGKYADDILAKIQADEDNEGESD